ncbi:MAG: DNA repair protein RecN [Vallitaleaceae bacterium]|nr:DNA repair protein RecN [Vallitaleaceae bacterium]
MLTYLHVKNIALIDELEVEFDRGFNIMTGETGAGKSIIIGSIDAVLGNKVSKDFIRKDEDSALIELIFQIQSIEVENLLKNLEIEYEEEVLISRKLSSNGRSIFKINGQVVSVTDVKELTALLIDLHSQHEHQSLLDKKNHIKLLDRYLGDQVVGLLSSLKGLHKKYLALKSEIKEFQGDEDARKREIAFLEFEVLEIEQAGLTPGEDEQLEQAYRKLSNIQSIQSGLALVQGLVLGHEDVLSASSQISKALDAINKVRTMDATIQQLSEQLEQIDFLMVDFGHDLLHYADHLFVDEEALSATRKRIDLINGLKMKHGNSLEDVLNTYRAKKTKMDQLVNYDDNFKKVLQELNVLEKEMTSICRTLTSIRKTGAKALAERIIDALKDLNLRNTDFQVKMGLKETFGIDGFDNVEFMISTNVGEEMKPLIQIASGGELSRIMLSIKSVLADCDEIGTLIFDEIDTGISGRTAQMVAEKMADLSNTRQLICITHLPQIAAMADHHYLIEKNATQERSITQMRKLKQDEIPNELARLIGGAKITNAVQASAQEMKLLANDIKRQTK